MKQSTNLIPVLAIAPLALAVLPSIQAQAQSDDLAPNAVCMSITASDGSELAIVTPASAVASLEAKGFTPEDCSLRFNTQQKREEYRDGVCHMASTFRQPQVAAFLEFYGEQPGVLCGMAEVAIAQWNLRFQD